MNPQEARDLEVAKEHCEAQKYRSDFIASAGSFLAGISYARANPINPGVSSCDDEKDAEEFASRHWNKYQQGAVNEVWWQIKNGFIAGRRSAPPTDSGLVELLREARGYIAGTANALKNTNVDGPDKLLARIDARLKGEK